MFRNLRINIFIYYFLTLSTFLTILYYSLIILEIKNLLLVGVVLLLFITLSGVLISKLAVDPLQEHVKNLQNLSKETLHELNLPISTIMTNTHLLKKNTQNEKELKRISRVESACSMLQERYNELDYMIKTQTLQELKEKFSLNQLIENRVKFLKAIYPHIDFNLQLQPTEITSDKIGLSKVIDNIIDNGVKYSPNATDIDIKLEDYRVLIRDYGCGMDEVTLLQIFDNYYQSNPNMKGFGIGLSMVKRFCDTNKIGLNFKSKKNSGTTVVLNFKEN